MKDINRIKTQDFSPGRTLLSLIETRPRQVRILMGFILSVILLSITDVLYIITFRHAAALDPQVYSVKLPAVDNRIPVIPVFFFGYIWSYVYWFFAPFFIIHTGKKKTWDFFITFIATSLMCSLILYFYPAKIDRVAEGLWDPSLRGFFWDLLHICYNVDGGKVSYNLMPSMHCANSVLYYQAMRDGNVPRWARRSALVSTVLVVISTLFTKQHYFLDVVTGVMIPVIVRPIVLQVTGCLRSADGTEAPDGK